MMTAISKKMDDGFKKKVCLLHESSKNGDLLTVKKLIEDEHYFVDQKYNGKTPLHIASENGHLDVVRFLCEKGANVDAKDIYEQTPLHIASDEGHLDVKNT